MRAMQTGLIDAGSSVCSLSVLLSAVVTSLSTHTALGDSSVYIGGNYQYTCSCTMCTSHGYYLRVVFISLRASDCAATIRWRCLIKEIWQSSNLLCISQYVYVSTPVHSTSGGRLSHTQNDVPLRNTLLAILHGNKCSCWGIEYHPQLSSHFICTCTCKEVGRCSGTVDIIGVSHMFMFANYALLGGGVRVREHSKVKRRSKVLLSL